MPVYIILKNPPSRKYIGHTWYKFPKKDTYPTQLPGTVCPRKHVEMCNEVPSPIGNGTGPSVQGRGQWFYWSAGPCCCIHTGALPQYPQLRMGFRRLIDIICTPWSIHFHVASSHLLLRSSIRQNSQCKCVLQSGSVGLYSKMGTGLPAFVQHIFNQKYGDSINIRV